MVMGDCQEHCEKQRTEWYPCIFPLLLDSSRCVTLTILPKEKHYMKFIYKRGKHMKNKHTLLACLCKTRTRDYLLSNLTEEKFN